MSIANKNLDLSGKKILMIAPCQGKFGGIETFCLTLIEDLLQKGANVRLLRKKVGCFQDDGSITKNESEIRKSLPTKQNSNFQSAYIEPRDKIIRMAISQSDLVHLHNPMVEGVWHAKRLRKPCAMTIYNWRRIGLHPRLLVWAWAVRQADKRWFISEFVWSTWERKKRKNSARLPVVSKIQKEETPPQQRRGFLFIGRWIPNKGIRILLEAYRQLSPDPSRWPLVLLGDGPLKPDVLSIIKEHNIKGVFAPGFVSESERQRYTRNAKWMVTPAHTREDLGLTPLEARSVGVPCIATKDGGLIETAGKHALFSIPGDVKSLKYCLESAINMNEDSYCEMIKMSKQGLQEYVRPLHEYAKEYLSLLQTNGKD